MWIKPTRFGSAFFTFFIFVDWFVCDWEYNVLDNNIAAWDSEPLTTDQIQNRIVAFNSVNTSKNTFAFNWCYVLQVHQLFEVFQSLGWPKEKISHWISLNLWKNQKHGARCYVHGTETVRCFI